MNKSGLIILIVLIAVLTGATVLWSNGSFSEAPATVSPSVTRADLANKNVALPNQTLTDYQGEKVALHSLVGKPLIINSWASWCPFCVNELPDFATVQAEFGEQVQFAAVNRAESLAIARGFTDELGISDDFLFLLDLEDNFYQEIGGFSMPETLFVSADGSVNFHKRGPMDLAEIRQRTAELIKTGN